MAEQSTRTSVAETAARAGGAVASQHFRTAHTVETKASKTDLVSAADVAAQAAVIDAIRAEYPDDPIVAEEGDGPTAVPDSGPVWLVDPIDGTANFVRGFRLWASCVAVMEDGDRLGAATVLPAMGDTYLAEAAAARRNDSPARVSTRTDPETFAVAVVGWGGNPVGHRDEYIELSRAVIGRFGDLRRLGSMQAALAFLASGELDAVISNPAPAPWDSVAGATLIEAAGGTVTDAAGGPWRHNSRRLVASNGQAHEAVCDAVPAGQSG